MATVTVLAITWIRYKKPDISMTLNGSLAGLVAVTAGCDTVTPMGAAAIGIIAGFVVVFGIEFIDQKLKIDDQVGAVGVHGMCGAVGTLLVGVFGYYEYGTNNVNPVGLVYGGGFNALLVQFIGVISVIAWVSITMTIAFLIIKNTMGLRVSKEEEIMGLDIQEHGISSAYADFMPVPQILGTKAGQKLAESLESDVATETVPVIKLDEDTKTDGKIHKIVIVTKHSRLEALKEAMNNIGVTGMTVTNVMGVGQQMGASEYYRGAKLDITLLPKIKIEIVVTAIPVETVVNTAKDVLYTGHIGDGKIFVYEAQNVVKVRTGETGYDALQD